MPDIRMNRNSMENAAKSFHAAQQQLQQSITEMEKIAKLMEDGALLGSGGDSFKVAIRTKLITRMKALADKMGEMESDIRKEIDISKRVEQQDTVLFN